LNKLTKIIVYAVRSETAGGVKRGKKNFPSTIILGMFIKKQHDKYTSALRVYEDENEATSALKYAFEAFPPFAELPPRAHSTFH